MRNPLKSNDKNAQIFPLQSGLFICKRLHTGRSSFFGATNFMKRLMVMAWAFGVGLLGVSEAGALTNPGFENGFAGWELVGQGWRTNGGADAYSGSWGAVNDILAGDADNWRIIHQRLDVLPGNLYSGGAYIRSVSVDNSMGYFELQFFNAAGSMIHQVQSAAVTNNQPFSFMGLNNVMAPAGAATVSVRGIVHTPIPPSNPPDFLIFDDFSFQDVTPPHSQLDNWGFEYDFSGWLLFGQGWNIGTGAYAYANLKGAYNIVNTNDTDTWRGAYQNIAVTSGLEYAAGIYIRTLNLESSQSFLEIQWYNSSGGLISQTSTPAIATDQGYALASLHSITSPPGAVTASVRAIVHMLSVPTQSPDYHVFDEAYFLRPVDLRISVSATTNYVEAYQSITYMVTVSNRSPSMSGAYTVRLGLPTELAVTNATVPYSVSGTNVTWHRFGLLGGSATTLLAHAHQPQFTGSTQQFARVISVNVTSDIGDPRPENNGNSITTITVGIPLLSALVRIILIAVLGWILAKRSRIAAAIRARTAPIHEHA
jgi:hypothetical protein